MCLLFILMMELFMYFQIWNLWYYFLCFLLLRFYILFPLQSYKPPILHPLPPKPPRVRYFSRNNFSCHENSLWDFSFQLSLLHTSHNSAYVKWVSCEKCVDVSISKVFTVQPCFEKESAEWFCWSVIDHLKEFITSTTVFLPTLQNI